MVAPARRRDDRTGLSKRRLRGTTPRLDPRRQRLRQRRRTRPRARRIPPQPRQAKGPPDEVEEGVAAPGRRRVDRTGRATPPRRRRDGGDRTAASSGDEGGRGRGWATAAHGVPRGMEGISGDVCPTYMFFSPIHSYLGIKGELLPPLEGEYLVKIQSWGEWVLTFEGAWLRGLHPI